MYSIFKGDNHPTKNFNLSKSEFDDMVVRLQGGDEFLVEHIFKNHFERCRVFLIKKFNASPENAYDISKDTLLKFRKNLMAGKIQYGNLSALFTIDARNTFLRMQKSDSKKPIVELDDQLLHIPDATEEPRYNAELVQQLESALETIGKDCAEMLNWHYYLELSLKMISENRLKRGETKFINEDAVKTKLADCRKKLKKMLTHE